MKFKCKYSYEQETWGSATHIYSLVGGQGAVHFWVREFQKDKGEIGQSGGVEIHRRRPQDNSKHDPPSHNQCWLLNAPCWHDGSSLLGEEWIRRWKIDPHDHNMLFCRLEGMYKEVFFDSEEG